MGLQTYQLVAGDWIGLERIINDLTGRVVGQTLGSTGSPVFAGLTLTGLSGVLQATDGVLSGNADHNSLGNIQGGTTDEYYHLTSAEYSALGGSISEEVDPVFTAWLATTPPLYSFTESDPIAMGYLDQSVKQAASPTFAGLTLNTLTGLLKGTSGVVSAIGGTSSQFVKGDGSLDSTTYLSTVPTIDAVLTAGSTSAANNMTLTAGTLTAAHLKGSGLTATRIPYSDATGLIDAAALTFDGTNVIGTGYARFDAGIGIGAIPSSISVFNVDYTTAGGITSASVGINVLFINTKQTTLGSQGPTTYGLRFDTRHLQTLTNNRTYTSGGVFGASGFARVYTNASESFNLTEFSTYGFQPIIDVSTGASSTGTLTVTNAYNFGGLIPTCGRGAGATYRGAITNMFCFYDPGMATTGVTNAWGIGINTANNYINGSLSIGKNTAPTVPLDVVGAILNTTTIEAGTGFKCGGTAAVADGTYTVGCKITPVTGADGTITTKGGIITAITQAT